MKQCTLTIKEIENQLSMYAALGRAYFSQEAKELKKRLKELRANRIK